MNSLLRHGFVALRRSPAFSFAIVATLGLALAATVGIFTLLDAFLLRPLPYGDASRLVVVYEHSLKGGRDNFSRVTFANVAEIQDRATSFARTGIFRNDSATIHGGDTTEVAFIQRVTADIFPMMGAPPALGTVISRANAQVGGLRTVLLSDALWRRRFGADPSVVGRVVRFDDTNYHVAGVMPADFRVPTSDDSPQAWLSLLPTDYMRNERTQRRHHFWGELAPGRALAAAESELSALAASFREAFPRENADRGLMAISLREDLLGKFGGQLVLLQGAVLLVLVVACFNCVCLLIARAIQRRREFAVRLALGAARRHLFAQLLAESFWLAAPAVVLALLLATLALPAGVAFLHSGADPTLRSLAVPDVDLTTALAVIGAAFLIALIFSVVPLLQTRRLNLEATLREGGRSASSPVGARAARWLAAGQIAVALALLISAVLLVRSQQNLARVDPGFPVAEFDQFRVGLRGDAYRDPVKRLQFFERVQEQLRALPGVRDVAVASFLFTAPPIGYQGFVQEGDGLELGQSPKRALPCFVLPDFASALGLKLIEGRFLTPADAMGRPLVTVINASLAAKYWPNESPVGRRVRVETARSTEWFEIVGVVSDVLGLGNQPRPLDTFYMTIAQVPPPGLGISYNLRLSGPRLDRRTLERAVWAVDPDMQVFLHTSPAEFYARAAWQARFVTKLVTSFAFLAVGLALAGIYAVNSFFVARRVSEFGIRAALGASGANLLRLVLGESLRLTLAGLAVGLLLAYAATRALAGLLYNVAAVDPGAYILAAMLMTLACLGATVLPARRASKIDPLVALRSD
jgi:putative ABC transport system permease protein